ncbi:response regulator [Jidongwangia harbinensis]|uniref:response regulator n=1 Tax=Jidongwangia harbinensis TaxID=2878561 RepID=UPI001CD9469A|nr:response regulator [Jidongwangia harbinensis]MCA2213315.1 response regulator [Jidongwangia harbinensis]
MLLIAEDDQNVRAMFERIFRDAGFTVLTETDGLAALHAIVRERPDVVLTDFDMPRLNGLELCRAIRGHHQLSDTPVAIISGSLAPGDPRAVEAQLCATLVKPFTREALVAAVRRLVDGGRHHHDAEPSPCPAAQSPSGAARA